MEEKYIVERAMGLAARYHAGQTRRDGTPYIYHPFLVADILKIAGFDERIQAAAICHDLLEDTRITEEEIADLGTDILLAVKLVTKNKNKGYREEEYVRQILQNPMAALVKSADKIHNVWNITFQISTGILKGEENERFAERYIKTARTTYFGKFNRALDETILRAEEILLKQKRFKGWELPFSDPADLALYGPQEEKG